MMDLFKPTANPKDLAITRAIQQSVEAFVAQDFEYADHCFEMAERFTQAPAELFTPETIGTP